MQRQEMTVINEAAVFKLALRSNKPEADNFANWVASEVLPAIRKTGAYVSKRRQRYEELGKPPEWIEEREDGITERKSFTETLQTHEVTAGKGFASCTNAIYRPVLGGTAAGVKMRMQLQPKANLRDHLSRIDLMKVKLVEAVASVRIETDDIRGDAPCEAACRVAASAIANAVVAASESPLS